MIYSSARGIERSGVDHAPSSAAIAVTLVTSLMIAFVLLRGWLSHDPAHILEVSLPGGDGRPPGFQSRMASIDLSGEFQQFDGVAAEMGGSWPRFRGPDFDNIWKGETKLAESWGSEGPEVLWSVELGEGHAAPVVLNGRVYILDYDEENRADAVRCFSLADGKDIWRRSYGITVKRNHGMSRTIPAVTDDYIVTLGPRCHVVCLNSTTGDFLWGIDLQNDYGTTEPLWHAGQCPLIDGDNVILAPGGPDTLMFAVDCATGSVVWKTPNPNEWGMSHSSIIPMTIADKRMYVYCALGGVVGVSAEEEDVGEILWEVPWDATVVAPSPVLVDKERILATAGYGKGSMMIQVREQAGSFSAEVLFEKSPKDGLTCEQQTPIHYEGLLFSIMPKDAGGLKGQFVCYDPEGSLVWSSGQANRFGLGPFLFADDKFFILSDDGVLTMLRMSREEYVQIAQAKILDGYDAWGPLALVGDRMLLRDSKTMVCIDLGSDK